PDRPGTRGDPAWVGVALRRMWEDAATSAGRQMPSKAEAAGSHVPELVLRGSAMKVVNLETIPVRIAYKHVEASSLIARSGVADVIVKVTAENGLVGWGECTRAADVAGIESAVKTMAPLVIGRSPWDKEAIHRDLATPALWAFQPMTGNFAYAGIDMALWD